MTSGFFSDASYGVVGEHFENILFFSTIKEMWGGNGVLVTDPYSPMPASQRAI